jgi:L-fuconolactonase
VIDAHQHFWAYEAREYAWIGEKLKALRRDFLPADLKKLQAGLGFKGSIAVQARQSLEEARWLLELASVEESILGVVGWVDLCSAGAGEQLKGFAGNPKFKGVRHVLQDEADDAFMLKPEFLRGLEAVQRLGLSYDILIYPRQLGAAFEAARRFPGLAFVLDHIAKPEIRDKKMEPWKEGLLKLASLPNVSCKLSGMVTEADWNAWKQADFEPYFAAVLKAFGPARLLFGSDWPVCTLAADYKRTFDLAAALAAPLEPASRAAIFGGNAARFYRC